MLFKIHYKETRFIYVVKIRSKFKVHQASRLKVCPFRLTLKLINKCLKQICTQNTLLSLMHFAEHAILITYTISIAFCTTLLFINFKLYNLHCRFFFLKKQKQKQYANSYRTSLTKCN